MTILNIYKEPTVFAVSGSLLSIIEGGGGTLLGPASKSVSGSTTTLSISSSSIVEQTYNCALVLMEGEGESFMAFPVKGPPPPAPPAPTPTPVPAPAALSIAKPKPLQLKADKWKTVKLKVTNTGATASVQGSLRVKPVKGINVKPETQKVPVLAPGASWSLSVKVELTEKAKKKSTLKLTGTATGATTGTGSLVVKLKK